MLNIIAIGGGDLGQGETLSLDQLIVDSTGKTHPNALFIPTASDDSLDYWNIFQSIYKERLGCQTDVLYLVREQPTFETIQAKIEWADLIYVGGGNTRTMLALWRRLGVDRLLEEAAQRGTILSGLSAGANCWFKYANSDAPIIEGEEGVKTVRVECLGLVDITMCPHMKREDMRLEEFTRMMQTTPGSGIGLDDLCALQIRGQEYRFVVAENGMVAHKIYWKDEQFHHEHMQPSQDFQPIQQLMIT